MNQQNDLLATDILGYLQQHEDKQLLRFITCGSVDDGKSTLIGRLLHDSKMIFEDQLASIEADSKKVGTQGEAIDLALLVDGLQSEREQGITIDVAYRYFATDKRKFIIADTPGHEQYTRNMVTGASTADLAIILVDARAGMQVQTRRHSYLVSMLGIKQVVVAINKMDLVEHSQVRFEQIKKEYQQLAVELGLDAVQYIPMSALNGDNVVEPSAAMPWYQGPVLLPYLETVSLSEAQLTEQLRFPVQLVSRPNSDFRGYAGTISAGQIAVGQQVQVQPSGKQSTVARIVTFDGDRPQAQAGDAVTLTLADEIDISRGELLVTPEQPAQQAQVAEGTVVWMADEPLRIGHEYGIKLATQTGAVWVEQVLDQTDVNTLERKQAEGLALNEIGQVKLKFGKTMLLDDYRAHNHTGSFIVVDKFTNSTVAAGMITKAVAAPVQAPSAQFSEFEIELNALVRKHFPHWGAADLGALIKSGSK
ncbi:sulfate adenylyltransferase subunit CysN [Ferrimonas lipolytica]|uniref:Sulfate adenylyltransferase subunit 1 n=1 Tax=Ferrimonas lipolytica TaxID=2724191 RepID=A0A6H1UA86_9GAMM|nr:sulfate adenylyltransferase subunit CysN [Ferrimonas lipolytica]QIZ75738.1 sulfate adenylyltransferase subunit CysN [Ferrimonas lipolytica]